MQKPGQQFDTMLAQPGEDDDIDLLAIFRTLWRGKILILFCVLLALVAGWYQAYRVATPIYSSTAQMALLLRSEQLIDLDSVISGVSGDEYSMNTEMEVIRSRDLVGRLVDQLGLIDDPEFNSTLPQPERAPSLGALVSIGLDKLRMVLSPPEPDSGTMPDEATIRRRVIDAVRSRISPQTREWSYIFTITVTSQSREKSALMANTMAAIYRDDQIRIKVEATENAAIWLAERVSQLQLELEQQQSAANALRAANALVSSEGLQALNAQALELRQLLHVAQGQLIRLEAQSAALTAVDGTSSIEARLAAASDAQLEAIAASVTAGDTSARARFDRRYAQILLQAQTDRSRLGQQVGELSAADRDLSQQLSQQSEEFQKLQLLDREAEATRILYETFLTRLKETSVQQGVHQPDSRILSEATPGKQVAPRKTFILASAIMIGLAIGLGFVLLREFLQNTFRTAEDLERKTGMVVLGQIPRVPARGRLGIIKYLQSKPSSEAAEAIRNLRTSVLLSNIDKPPQVIMSTSSIPGEGKTTLAVALAQNFAGLDKRVLLIEGDIRRRIFENYFKQDKDAAGLISVVSGQAKLAEAVYRPAKLNFDVLMGEKSPINAADLFSSDSFKNLLIEARSQYDYIIIDTPPVLVVPDARVIAQLSDAVLYSVRWDATTTSQVAEGLRQFRAVDIGVSGLVLSQVDPRGMRRYGYGSKYGAHTRFGRGYYQN